MAEAAEDLKGNPKIVNMPIDPQRVTSVGVGPVQFDINSTLRSPFFWMAVGATAFWLGSYYLTKSRK